MEALDSASFRGRIKAGADIRYAFWLGSTKYKAGASGLMLDKSGVHETNTPDWFTQSSTDYPEHKPPLWPSLGAVLYGIDTEQFGEHTVDEAGALGLTKHMDYVQGLGVNGLWLNTTPNDSDDAIDTAKHADLHVVVEGSSLVKGIDGIASLDPPATKLWRVAITNGDGHATIESGAADTALDGRWPTMIFRFVREIGFVPSAFDGALRHFREDYPDAAADQLVLRLCSPDSPRPSGELKGDKARIAQAWMLLFTLPGIPLFDAGDEIGMFGPGGRMIWEASRQDSTLLDMVKKLIVARVNRPSLYRGNFTPLLVDDDSHVYAYERDDRFELTIAIFNNGDDPQPVRISAAQFGSSTFRDLIGSATISSFSGSLTVSLPPHGCVLLGT
jgi:hypothetical protein